MSGRFVKLGDVCEVQNGFAFDSKYFSTNESEGKPLIRIRDILNGYTSTYYTSDYQKEYIVHNGDFLIGMDGDFNIGQWKSNDALLNQRVCRLIPSEKILPRFIYYFIPPALAEINSKTAYTTVKHLSSKQVKSILLPDLSLEEQQRIVDFLDAEFDLIAQVKYNAEESLKRAIDLFKVSANSFFTQSKYPLSSLGDECMFVRGPFGGSLKKSCFVDAGYPVYEQQHAIYNRFVFRYFINDKKYHEMERFTVNSGDIIMSCSGTIGKVAVIPDNAPRGIINQALLKLTPKPSILSDYLKWYMSSMAFDRQIQTHSQGAAIKNVASVAILKQLSIPVPTLDEQKEIITHLNNLQLKIDTLQDNYSKIIALCNDLRRSLLSKVFNGEL